ncbi:MAG: YggS family pyridoxal phosphate-dependent enzyme [Calditrichaeota bacterium]|nr:YggS family pyridoxal phosphate-dependent enzyme [Calditrichota bacterium]
MMNTIKEALRKTEERINRACERCGRRREEITLIAVTKTFPPEVIQQAYDLGLKVFGENRPQEFRDKSKILPDDIEWHFIGHLQTNKIKYVVPRARLIHSVDSMHLAEALSEFAVKKKVTVPILLEVNTSGEQTKFGFKPDEVEKAFELIAQLQGLQLKGLMTIGPFTEDQRLIRKAFVCLRQIREKLRDEWGKEKTAALSMGMSGDFEIAIEEGSTHIRLGTAIFGQRGR